MQTSTQGADLTRGGKLFHSSIATDNALSPPDRSLDTRIQTDKNQVKINSKNRLGASKVRRVLEICGRVYKEASRCILNDLQTIEWRFIDSISEQHIAVVQPGTNTSIDYLLQIVKREERFDYRQKRAFTTEFTCLSSLRIYTNTFLESTFLGLCSTR